MRSLLDSFLANRSFLSRFVGRMVSPEDIEDIVQETFVQSFAAARRQPIANPQAYMLRTARNLALNHIGKADNKNHSSIDDVLEEDIPAIEPMEEQYESREWFLIFCRSVAQLPLQCRRAFILKKVYGLSLKEIAGFLGISPSTAEKHVAKGMVLTTRYMREQGYRVSGFKRTEPNTPYCQGKGGNP